MQRTKKFKIQIPRQVIVRQTPLHRAKTLVHLLAMMSMLIGTGVTATAQPGRANHAHIDYDASGFVSPAGMVAPAMHSMDPMVGGFPSGFGMESGFGDVAQVGMSQRVHGCGDPSCKGSCDSAPMSMMGGGCDGFSYFDGSPCGPGYGSEDFGFIDGHGNGGLASRLQGRHGRLCLFCRGEGDGCGVCNSTFSPLAVLGLLGYLRPYQDAGLGAQRWYDLSAEGMFLSRSMSPIGLDIVTRQGAGPTGTPILLASQLSDDDFEAGVRASGALLVGPGSNIEATYLGAHEWEDRVTVSAPAVFNNATPPVLISGANLFSFITNFGTTPLGGLDDVDRSVSQSISSFARFHSGEINYRRRTVGPYKRFQGSWLAGLRYLRYDNGLGLNIVGLNDDGLGGVPGGGPQRFFNGAETVNNSMLGAQVGGDFWWNVMPGVNLGFGGKGLWMTNNIRGRSSYFGNSLSGTGGAGVFTQQRDQEDGTLAAELEASMIYRLSYSWAFRCGYYLLNIEDVATPTFDGNFIRNSVQTGNPASQRDFIFDSVTIQGFTVGAEYLW